MIRCVCDRCEMENGVELFVAKLFSPIQRSQILRDQIPAVSGEIFEITGAKVVDHGETRVRKFFLQRKSEIGADETGAASDNQVRRRSSQAPKNEVLDRVV